MSIERQDACARATAVANAPDLDHPTRPRQVVYDEYTEEHAWGWVFYLAADDEFRVAGRDPEARDNLPVIVLRETGEVIATGPGDSVERLVAARLRT